VWLKWEQCKHDFDPYTKKLILALDVEVDIAKLQRHLDLDAQALANMRISYMLLIKGVVSGLTLYQIADIIARPDFDEQSTLEKLMQRAAMLTAQTLEQPSCRPRRHTRKKSAPLIKRHDDDAKEDAGPASRVSSSRLSAIAPKLSQSSSCVDTHTTASVDAPPSQSRTRSGSAPTRRKLKERETHGRHSTLQSKYSPLFMYHLEWLVHFHFQSISKATAQAMNVDDDIYAIDSVDGSFAWKNDLRFHWIRSRLELKKQMEALRPKPKDIFEESACHDLYEPEQGYLRSAFDVRRGIPLNPEYISVLFPASDEDEKSDL